ncbi:MAG: hypothetical protein R2757_03405 [Draconibacterium sp.]
MKTRVVEVWIFVLVVSFLTACSSKKKSTNDNDFPSEMVKFQPIKENPLFKGTGTDTWDKKIRERGYILFEDGIYKMWYTGYNPALSEEKYMGYATSEDGVQWKRYSDKPIFDKKWTEDIFVIKNEGEYYMYAEGANDVAHLLTSPDGLDWTEQGDITILTTKGDTIAGPYGTPTVWIENGKWYLFYERNDMAIWLAKSEDKLTWTNVQDDPVLPLGPDQYDIGAVAADQVVKYNGKYFIYYHATSSMDWQHPASPVTWTSNVAMSTDLIHWTKYPENPIVKGDYSSPILVFDGRKPSLYTMHSEVCRYNPK